MSKKGLYFYDFNGGVEKSHYGGTELVSEVKLNPFSKKLKGKCAMHGTKFGKIRVGTTLSLALGDPRVIKNARLVSKKRTDAPKNIRAIAREASWRNIFTFKYKGKNLWCNDFCVCTLESLLSEK